MRRFSLRYHMGRARTRDRLPATVLVGMDSYVGLQTARILSRRGVTVVGVAANPRSAYCRTRALSRVLEGSPGLGSLTILRELAGRLGGKPVLLPCSDEWVLFASRQRDELGPHFTMVMPSSATVEMLMDKSKFYAFARRAGYPVVPYETVRTQADVARASDRLRFPVIVKPTRRSQRWADCAGEKAVRLEDSDALAALVERCEFDDVQLVVQEWIEGSDRDLIACNIYRNTSAETLVTFVTRKIRQYPPLTGQACLAEEARADDLLAMTESLFETAGLAGIGYLEWKQDARSGQYFIIEPTIWRPPGRLPITEAAGVDFLFTAYCDAAGLPLPLNRTQRYGDAKWIYLTRDFVSGFQYFRRGELSLPRWWGSLRGPKYFAVFSWRDPIPFLADVPQTLARARRRGGGSRDPGL